jgi:hypothetical protein
MQYEKLCTAIWAGYDATGFANYGVIARLFRFKQW